MELGRAKPEPFVSSRIFSLKLTSHEGSKVMDCSLLSITSATCESIDLVVCNRLRSHMGKKLTEEGGRSNAR